MKKMIVFVLSMTLGLNAFSFSLNRGYPDGDEIIKKSLTYLANQQYSESKNLYSVGEWPVNMKAYFLPALLGVGKLFARPTDEPTSFATSSVLNLLSEAYLLNPQLQQIKPLIKKGLLSLPQYKDGDVYSYYQWQIFNGVKVRGPLAEGYVPDYIRGLTNIPADADTTSVTYTALAYNDVIESEKKFSDFIVPTGALETFNTFRDLNRKPHYYNRLDSIKNSGAFLTWFLNDHDPKMPRGVFAKPDKGTRIPFNFNDVDCVVNANVLRLLTLTNNQSHPGYADSCRLMNFVIEKNKQTQCGIYYPNSYAVFFSASNVYKAGATCLEKTKNQALSFLISTQKDDGSWDNEPGIGQTDTVQSTALAMNALMNYSEKGNSKYQSSLRSAARYLLTQFKKNGEDEVYWKGEVFFSAVAQARNTVLWRSNAYTTALVVLALTKAQVYLDHQL